MTPPASPPLARPEARPRRGQRAARVLLLAGTTILLAGAATEAVAAAGFALGRTIGPAILMLGVALALAVTAALARLSPGGGGARAWWAGLAVALATALASGLAAGLLHDRSFDGQWYHQRAVEALARYWNPFAGHLPGELMANHYARGAWYRAAALRVLGAPMETGKAWNLALAAAAGMLTFAAAIRLAEAGTARATAVALIAAANPVAIYQAATFYVDGQLSSALTALAAAGALAVVTAEPAALAAFGAAVAIAVQLKFTGVVYATGLGAAAVGAALLRRDGRSARRVGCMAAAALAIALVGTGFDPYVTNTRERGHPFWPLAGRDTIDVMLAQYPAGFERMGRVRKLAISLLAIPDDGPRGLVPRLKVPFGVGAGEDVAFRVADVRLGGLGPWFSGALCLSLALAGLSLAAGARRAAPALGAAGVLLASVLVNPECWWARYAPQLWLVPIALALAPAARFPRAAALLRRCTLLALAADAGFVAACYLQKAVPSEAALRQELRALAGTRIAVEVHTLLAIRYRLADAGIAFYEPPALPCASPRTFVASDARYCPPAPPASR